MEILKDISILWAMAHTLIMFLFLFESRYPKKKSITISLTTMIPLIIFNVMLFIVLGPESYSSLMLLTLSLPSCIVFWHLAKYRDGRFFFTFCMVDTLVLEIVYITNILNFYITPNTNLLLFFVRLISYPLIEIWIYKKLRPMYLEVQKNVTQGWGIFALIGILFYVAITLNMSIPNIITSRPEQLPALVLLFILMPIIYLYIVYTLRNLQRMYEMTLQEDLLTLQVSNLSFRMDELAKAEENFRIERHNFRHKLNTITGLIQKEQYDECLNLLSESTESFDKTKVEHYCQHKVLDAVLSTYLQKSKQQDIRLDFGFAFPDLLPANESELATVIANALENAIFACQQLKPEDRFIEIKIVSRPNFMIRITNSFNGKVKFNEDGLPITSQKNHGIGTRFIAAFCHKNKGYYDFRADAHTFTMMLNF